MNVRKIIAREGLIILAILFLSGVLLVIANSLPHDETSYKYKVLTNNHHYEMETSAFISGINNHEDQNFIMRSITEKHPNDFSQDEIEAISKSSFVPDDFKIEYIGPQYSFRTKCKSFINMAGLFVLILLYPGYLIVSFISWSIKTLRTK